MLRTESKGSNQCVQPSHNWQQITSPVVIKVVSRGVQAVTKSLNGIPSYFLSVLFGLAVFLAGCSSIPQPALPAGTPTSELVTPTPSLLPDSAVPTAAEIIPLERPVPATAGNAPTTTNDQLLVAYGYTYQQPDGNRLVSGQGNLPDTLPLDIPLAGEPTWIVAAPTQNGGSLWAVALTDGRTQAFGVDANGHIEELVEPNPITRRQLPPGMPPLLKVEGDTATLPVSTTDEASLQTHPIFLPETQQMVSVQADGQLLIWSEDLTDFTALAVNALPDARLLFDDLGRLLLLTEPTPRYGHGVLGDGLEAASITLIETQPEPQVVTTIPIPDPTVVEGIAPIWVDLDGDGSREIIVTLSNSAQGAQVVVFNEAGEQVATGPAIGQGSRWRHQLAAAAFGPDGETELIDVLTPHIGGTVEFYQLDGDELRVVARLPGYTSHMIGTRNLDMAVAGDFDGDERIELLLPNQRRTELGAIQRTADGAEVEWSLPVEGVVTTNLAAVPLEDGRVIVGIGREDGVLRLWGP
jgi:hypothetical protein